MSQRIGSEISAVGTPAPRSSDPSGVAAAIDRFGRENGAIRELDAAQKNTLAAILRGPNGPIRGQAYIGMIVGGLPLTPGASAGSQKRFDDILDAAVQVYLARNTSGQVRGLNVVERMDSFALLADSIRRRRGSFNDEAVRDLRAAALTSSTIYADQYVPPQAQRPDVTGVTAPQAGTEIRQPISGRALDVAGLRAATRAGDFDAVRKNLEATQQLLRENPKGVDKQQLAQYIVELDATAKAADKKESRGFWDILLAILTLGLPLVWDHFTESDAEKVQKLSREVQGKVGQLQFDPEGDVLGSIYGHEKVPPPRRAGDKIPGTKLDDTPQNIAKVLDDYMSGVGTSNERHLLEITHARSVEERIAISEAYWRLKGEKYTGREAFDRLYKKMQGELDGLFGKSLDGHVIRCQWDPANSSGQLQPHDMIQLDLDGWISQNGAAIQRLLMRCDAAQLHAIDLAMREKYGQSLEQALKRLGGEDEARALFLVRAPRVNGEVPAPYLRAYELIRAVDHKHVFGLIGGTDQGRLFVDGLHQLSHEEYLETAKAYYELTHDRPTPVPGAMVDVGGQSIPYAQAERLLARETDPRRRELIIAAMRQAPTTIMPALWPMDAPGDDGRSGDVKKTALYQRVKDDLVGIFEDDLLQRRHELAAQGIVYKPDPKLSPQDQAKAAIAHSNRVAEYIAVSIRLAGKGKMEQAETVAVLKLMRADPLPGQPAVLDGRPTAGQVGALYTRLYPNLNIRKDINAATEEVTQDLAHVALDGKGFAGPAGAAVEIISAMGGVLTGTKEDIIYRALDRPDLSPQERTVFLREVAREYAKRTGGKDLRKDMLDECGRELKLPDGRKIPSRAARLLDNGVLTPAERLVFAMHEPGLLNIFAKTEGDIIMTTLAGLSPLEKVVAVSEYHRLMTGQPWNPEQGSNLLVKDLERLSGHDVRRAGMLAEIIPSDVSGIVLEVAAYMNAQTNPVVDKWIRENLGDPEKWIANNFPDEDPRRPGVQNKGLELLRELVNASGGPAQFAQKLKVTQTEAQFTERVRGMVTDARGNGLSRMLMDFFGPEGKGVQVYADKVAEAVRVAESWKRDHGGQYNEQHLARIQQHYAELMARVAQYDELKDKRVEFASNVALTIAVGATLVVAPEVSPAILFGIGAVTKAGTHLAFGERDMLFLLQQAIRGGTTALIGKWAAMQMASLPADVSMWVETLYGGYVGAVANVMHGAVERGTDGQVLQRGVLNAGGAILEGAYHDIGPGFLTGAAASLAMRVVRDVTDRLRGSPDDGGTPPPDNGGNPPDNGGNPPDGGQTPDRGGRPPNSGGDGTPGRGGRAPDSGGPGAPTRGGRAPTSSGGSGGNTGGTTGGTPGRGGTTGDSGGTGTPGRGGTGDTGATGTTGSGTGRGGSTNTGNTGTGRGGSTNTGTGRGGSTNTGTGRGGGTTDTGSAGTGRGGSTNTNTGTGRGGGTTDTGGGVGRGTGGQAATGRGNMGDVGSTGVGRGGTGGNTGGTTGTGTGRGGTPGTTTDPGRGGTPGTDIGYPDPGFGSGVDTGAAATVGRRGTFLRALGFGRSNESGGMPAGTEGVVGFPQLPTGFHIAGASQEVNIMGLSVSQAAVGLVPLATKQVLVGGLAYHLQNEIAKPDGAEVNDASWRQLIGIARDAGIVVDERIPASKLEAAKLLEQIRRGAIAGATGHPTDIRGRTAAAAPAPGQHRRLAPIGATPEGGSAPAPAPSGGRRQLRPTDGAPAPRSDATRPAATDPESQRLERLETTERARERVAALRKSPLFAQPPAGMSSQDFDAWIAVHGNAAMAFLAGEPLSSFDKKSPEQMVAAITDLPEGVAMDAEGTVWDRLTRAEQGLASGFGAPVAAPDGVLSGGELEAFGKAMAIFGPAAGDNQELVANNLRYLGGMMEEMARETGRQGIREGMPLDELRNIVKEFTAKMHQAGLVGADANIGDVIGKFTAYKNQVEAQRIAEEQRRTKAQQVNAANTRLTEALADLAGGMKPEAVQIANEVFTQLEGLAKENIPGAQQALDTGKRRFGEALNTPQRVAEALAVGVNGSETLRTVTTERVNGMSPAELGQLGEAIVGIERGRAGFITSLPEGLTGKIARDATGLSPAAQAVLLKSVKEGRDVEALLGRNLEHWVDKAPRAEAGAAIAALTPANGEMIRRIGRLLAERANSHWTDAGQRPYAELLLYVADANPAVASGILREMYTKLDGTEKDDFAMVLAQPRKGKEAKANTAGKDRVYDAAISGLAKDVKEEMAYHLYRDTSLFYVIADGERDLAYYLRGENAKSDRYDGWFRRWTR